MCGGLDELEALRAAVLEPHLDRPFGHEPPVRARSVRSSRPPTSASLGVVRPHGHGALAARRHVAEPVVEQHGGAVHEVRDHDLADLARRLRAARVVEHAHVAEVVLEVDAVALLAA